MASSNDPIQGSWRRWFRRTNVHTAEYILMLFLFGGLIGLLVSQWGSLFQLFIEDGSAARSLAKSTATQIGSLLILLPAAFWMYFRVTGQESVEPELQKSKPRNVFLIIWTVFATLALVSLGAKVVGSLVSIIFGYSGGVGDEIVGVILPSLFGVVTLAFGISAVVKHPSRKYVKLAAVLIAATAVVLLLANTIMVFVKKNAKVETNVNNDCTYSRYRDGDCSYSDYLKSFQSDREDSKSEGSDALESLLNLR